MKIMFDFDASVAEQIIKERGMICQSFDGQDVYIERDIRNSLNVKEQIGIYHTLKDAGKSKHLYRSGDLEVNCADRTMKKNNVVTHISAQETYLLDLLMTNPHRVLTRPVLIEYLEGYTKHLIQDNTLTVHMSNVKKLVGSYQGKPYIETKRQLGYYWTMDVQKGQ